MQKSQKTVKVSDVVHWWTPTNICGGVVKGKPMVAMAIRLCHCTLVEAKVNNRVGWLTITVSSDPLRHATFVSWMPMLREVY